MPETTDALPVRLAQELYEETADLAAVSEPSPCDAGTHAVTLYINEGTEDRRVIARCQNCSCVWTLAVRVLHHPILAEDPTP